MIELIQRVRTSAAIRNFALVTSATAVSQAANFAWTPFLARLYDPAAFGALSVFMSAVMTVSLCASLCLEQAIVLEREDSDAFGLFVASCALVMCCAVAAGLVASFCRLGAVLSVLVSFGVLAAGLGLPLSAWCTRRRAFRATTASQLARVATVITAQAIGALCGASAMGLIVGYLSGEVVASAVLAFRVLCSERKTAHMPEPRAVWQLICRHRNFPLYTAPQTLLNTTSQSLPAFLLAACFGAPVAGAYWLAVRVLLVPCTLAGNAFRQVYYEYACRLNRSEASFYPALRSATLALAAASCAFLVTAVVLGPRVFALIFGGAWLLAGQYVVLLAPWTAALFTNLPSVSVLPILGRQRFALVFDVVGLAARGLALGGGALVHNHIFAVAAYSGVGLVLNVSLILIVFNFARGHNNTATFVPSSTATRYA